MKYTDEEDIPQNRVPQGAFGVDEMYLIELQHEIEQLSQKNADTETSTQFNDKVNELNAKSPYMKFLVLSTIITINIATFVSYNIDTLSPSLFQTVAPFIHNVFTVDLFVYLCIGIVVQILDGALGMGYGVACSSFLLGLGLTPVYTSATVHLAKSFNTGISGIQHLRFKSLNQKLFRSLLIPGILGSVLGAWLLADVINNDFVKPFIALYLLTLGILILIKPFRAEKEKKRVNKISLLAVLGGLVDSIGGGGWGPIVTSNLIRKGRVSSYSVGSINIVEFFVAMSAALTFIYFGNFSSWQSILGLIMGGIIAYPFTSFIVSKINKTAITLVLGSIVIGFSIHTFFTSDYTTLTIILNPSCSQG